MNRRAIVISAALLAGCTGPATTPVAPAACDSCHGAPPANGAHARHFGAPVLPTTYGGLGTTGDLSPLGAAYAFDCGNCHPLDPSKHQDGLLQVELHSDTAPPGSLKALTPADAAWTPGPDSFVGDVEGYTDGSCSSVYCHSRSGWDAPTVPAPGVDFDWTYGVYPIVYPAFTVTTTRSYLSPKWVGETLGCGGCHELPPTSVYPANVAGAGDSHLWIDAYGYGNLHGNAMGTGPIACATCHFETVQAQGERSADANGIPTYADLPITGAAAHVNGRVEVRFTSEPIVFGPSLTTPVPFSAATGATWDGATRSCSAVSCHLLETSVRWGTPYRGFDNTSECMACHRL